MFAKPQLVLLGFTLVNLVHCEVYRLPQNVKPKRYFLTLEPHLRDTHSWRPFPYNGSVTIEIEILQETDTIQLHKSPQFLINSESVKVYNSEKEVPLRSHLENEANEYYEMKWQEALNRGIYNLTIGNFTGDLGWGEGFFRAFYFTKESDQRGIAATHFEPTGARRAFPCFDEPAIKATFIVSLIRKNNYTSVSNENLDYSRDLGDGRFEDTFKETPVMSTYTLAFAVTDYKSSEKVERHRILGPPHIIDDGDWKFSLDVAVKTLKTLENYTGVDYILDKIDHISIPDHWFHDHAMENWGLVVYGESHLMRNNNSRAEDYKRSATYIAHELAHQWFGNLVTPAWWDYLWVSESFAAYFQYHTADSVKPEWRLKEQFLIDMVHVALKQEERKGAHPLNSKVEKSGDYPPFHIMYEKGSAIIRMAAHFLSNEVFRRGLNIYLEKNKFGSAFPSDVYAALQQAVVEENAHHFLGNRTVSQIMTSWDSVKGFPIVTVTRDYATGDLTLSQKPRFISTSTINHKWIIPINYVFSDDKKFDFTKTLADVWLDKDKLKLNNLPKKGWLIINKQQTGYYRVNYDEENWNRIIAHLNSDQFLTVDPMTRAQLISDSFNLAYNKYIPFDIPLRLSKYLLREKDYIPLSAFYSSLFNFVTVDYNGSRESKHFKTFKNYTLLNEIVGDQTNVTEADIYKKYVQTTLSGIKDTLGFKEKPSDTFVDKLHRTKLWDFYYYFDDSTM